MMTASSLLEEAIMTLGQKRKFTGTVKKQLLYAGSKSEHEGFVLVIDGINTLPRKIRIMGGSPFYDASLEPFAGKRVSLEGIEGSGVQTIFVEKLSDISIIAPPQKKKSPPQPK